MSYNLCRLALWAALSAPLFANTQFNIRRMSRNDVPFGKGQCDIRLQIDGEAEVSVRGDAVYIRTLSGRDGRDDGSECNEPFPMRDVRNFNFDVKDSRGDIALIDEPGRRGGGVTVRIRDSKGGEGRYHFRLSWDIGGGGGFPGGGGGYRPEPGGRRFSTERAIEICGDEVRNRIANNYRFDRVDIRTSRLDDRPGRNDYILGEALGRRGGSSGEFTFVCRVDFDSGRVRSVDVNRR